MSTSTTLARTSQSADQPSNHLAPPAMTAAKETHVSLCEAKPPPDLDHSAALALRLNDAQLDAVMKLCRPLAPHCRDALLQILAHELRGRHDVGDGELHRWRAPSSRTIGCLTRRRCGASG
jgi:hypothetical protein